MAPLRKNLLESVDSFNDVPVTIEARFEERLMDVRDILAIRPGAVVRLSQPAGETLDVYVGNVLLASAEVTVLGDRLALRITEFVRFDP